jgi:beta-glucosidase
LREVYLPPFEAAVRAGAGSIMCSFNEIAGVPSSGNRQLLTGILRGEWGFDGFVVSDWGSIGEMVPHGFAASRDHAAILALRAGVDMDMESNAYATALAGAVRAGTLDAAVLDEAVRRVLRTKFRLGLFDDPFRGAGEDLERQVLLSAEHRALAREVAARSIVLLKNSGGPGGRGILPLGSATGTIAVIGPLAASTRDPLGPWSAQGDPRDVVTVLDGIRAATGARATVTNTAGCPVDSADRSGIDAAVAAARDADAVVLALGEAAWMSGEAASRTSLDLPGVQNELARAVIGTGKPVIVVLLNGRPLTIGWLDEHAAAILEAWLPGVEGGNAIADVLFGRVNPSGKLPVTFPRNVGQVPIYHAQKNTGRPADGKEKYTSKYLDAPNAPLYPFGYGLSYTTFRYSSLRIQPERITGTGSVRVSVDVTNTGSREGTEVVQLYLRDEVASFTRPVRELRGFRRVTLAPGEFSTVTFELKEPLLSLLDSECKRVVEAGRFTVFVGGNSMDGQAGSFRVAVP